MSTYPTTRGRRTDPETGTGPVGGDRWAVADRSADEGPLDAPLTFDPFCTRRLPNAVDRENKHVSGPRAD